MEDKMSIHRVNCMGFCYRGGTLVYIFSLLLYLLLINTIIFICTGSFVAFE